MELYPVVKMFNKKQIAMKKLVLIISMIAMIVSSGKTEEKEITSSIDKVTVFQQGAQIERTGKISLQQGISQVIFDKVSPGINNRTIQVSGRGGYVILDVEYRIKYPDPLLPVNQSMPPQIIKDIQLLEDSIAYVNFELNEFMENMNILVTEKNLLMNNKLVQGNSDTIPEIKEAMAYLRSELLAINKEYLSIQKKQYLLNKNKARMDARLYELRNYNAKVNVPVIQEQPKYQIVVSVTADKAIAGEMTVSYFVNSAGWSPQYDLRADQQDKPVTLVYKASVFQNTGEDWGNVKLKLSTQNPSTNYTMPKLSSIYLSYQIYQAISYTDRKKDRSSYPRSEAAAGSSAAVYELDDELALDLSVPTLNSANYTQSISTLTGFEYDINLKYSIPSDGKNHMVSIQNNELTAKYFHYLIPKVNKESWLVAKITDWEEYDLLPGKANIYYGGSFVGETTLDPGTLNDTLELTLGKDRNVIADLEKDKDESRNELIGNNIIKSQGYKIRIRNPKTFDINLVVTDQIPVSTTKDIVVKMGDHNCTNFNEKSGILTWNKTLKAGEKCTFFFSYSIEHDKDTPLAQR